ncbi:MAG: DUF899 domain-containing protein, partial [Planctomycetota bacterium]
MTDHRIVSREDWIVARREFLKKEKEFTRLRDELSAERRALPWVKVEKDYRFQGPNGEETLSDLFDGKSQLLTYHFMFDPEWEEGCKSCSYLVDNYHGAIEHMKHRDVTLVTVARAPLEKLDAFKKRMGWTNKWVSSFGSDFNFDYQVSFPPDAEEIEYNYGRTAGFSTEGPGISAFFKDADGAIYHTYSSYSRGLDMIIGAYHLIDMVAKG